MSVRKVVRSQYQGLVDQAAQMIGNVAVPKEGWIRVVRKAFGMSGAQLAKRLGVTRAAVSNKELAELSGSITIKKMHQLAEALNCRFVYAVVPQASVQSIIDNRAREKALSIVQKANQQMALEDQSLSKSQIASEIDRVQEEILRNFDSEFWND